MLRVVQIEEIRTHLLALPALVSRVTTRDAGCIDDVQVWVGALERMLASNRLLATSAVAALRLILRNAEDGVVPTGISLPSGAHRRLIRFVAASEVLRRAEDLAVQAIREDVARLNDALNLSRQLVAIARAKSLPPFVNPSVIPGAIALAWRALLTDSDLGPGAVRLQSLVGPQDALIVLDQIMAIDRL